MSDHVGALQHAIEGMVESSLNAGIADYTAQQLYHWRVFKNTLDESRNLADLVLDLDELAGVLELCQKAVSAEQTRRMEELNEMMTELDEPVIPRRGYSITRKTVARYSPDGDEAVPALRENGYPDIGKWSVHWKTFDSTVNEIVKDAGEVPDWLDGKVTKFEQHTVAIKKGK